MEYRKKKTVKHSALKIDNSKVFCETKVKFVSLICGVYEVKPGKLDIVKLFFQQSFHFSTSKFSKYSTGNPQRNTQDFYGFSF